MPRLFIAIDPSESVRDRLAGLQGGVPGARWVRPDNIHLTLLFLGEVDAPTAADLDTQLGRIGATAFELRIAGVGTFGPARNPTALWAGAARSRPLRFLHDKVDRAAVAAGLPADDRKFKPHLTLARLKGARVERLRSWLSENDALALDPVEVDRFILFRSHLNRDGAIHEPLAEYPLTVGSRSETPAQIDAGVR